MENHINTPSHVDVLELFREVVDVGIPHCRICYRTSREIKLVRPDKLLQFVGCLKQQVVFGSSALDKSACIICEGAAAATMRLTDAIMNAVDAKNVMQAYSQKRYAGRFKMFMNHKINPCNAKLNTYRDRTTFKQTEVLIVDSLGLEWTNKSDGNDKGPTRVDLSAVVKDNPPIVETVVLDDDDDCSRAQNAPKENSNQPQTYPSDNTLTIIQNPPEIPKLVPIHFLLNNAVDKAKFAALVPNKMQLITGHSTLLDNFVLHEIIMHKNGSISVPGLSCDIKDGRLVYNHKLLNSYHFLVANQVADTNNPTTSDNASQSTNITDTTDDTSEPVPVTSDNEKRRYAHQNSQNDASVASKPVLQHKNTSTDHDLMKNGRFLSMQSLNNTKFNDGGLSNISIIDIKGADGVSNASQPDTSEMTNVDNILRKHLENKRPTENTRTDLPKKPRKELLVNLNINNCLVRQNDDVIAVISDVTSQAEPSVGEKPEQEIINPEKRPLEKGSRIDWEDKIPMDVISFMDATDPNAELIVPDPLPTQKPPDTLVVKQEDYIIDLC